MVTTPEAIEMNSDIHHIHLCTVYCILLHAASSLSVQSFLLFRPSQCTFPSTLFAHLAKDVYPQAGREIHALVLFQGLNRVECLFGQHKI